MKEHITTHVGLDVHKTSTAIAVAERHRPARFVGTVGAELGELRKVLSGLDAVETMQIVYEAGPCGYALVRALRSDGYRCEVIAPGKVARRAGDRVKTDRRDALHLAEQSRAGALTAVWVPDEADEAIRDLSRAREDAVRMRMKARQRLQSMLLRHGHRYSGKTRWTAAHERYLAQRSFAYPAQELAYVEYRQAVGESHERVERLTAALRDQVSQWRMQTVVRALMTLRGIDFIAAATLIAELGDLQRFAHPRELMSFVGLVPSERTTGDHREGVINFVFVSHSMLEKKEQTWLTKQARLTRSSLTSC
ncbi:MAG: IS110 family transposase [Acidiferrobacterales bacterium]|nr:IS110 family transposase [Acidiferrobacterales bacterium]